MTSLEPTIKKTVALLSGGLDSSVATALALETSNVVFGITFNYGQRAFEQEVIAAERMARYFDIPFDVITLPWMGLLLPEALQSQSPKLQPILMIDVPTSPLPELGLPAESNIEDDGLTSVWVPNRNGVLLNAAAAFAETLSAKYVVFGANADEAQAFPDNTMDFVAAMNRSLYYSTRNHVEVIAPVAKLTKAQIIAEGQRLQVPLHVLWSCYEQGSKDGATDQVPTHCGVCPSCQRLKNALNTTKQTTLIDFKN